MEYDQPPGSSMSRQFAHHRNWVGLKEQHIPPDNCIERSVELHLRRIALSKGYVGETSLSGAAHRRAHCSCRGIRANHFAGPADEFGGEESDITGSATDVEHAHACTNSSIE